MLLQLPVADDRRVEGGRRLAGRVDREGRGSGVARACLRLASGGESAVPAVSMASPVLMYEWGAL